MKKTINYDNYIVGFLDVLGQKESFIENGKYIDEVIFDESLDQKEMVGKLVKAHANSIKAIEILRNGLDEFYDAFTKERLPHKLIPVDKRSFFTDMHRTQIGKQVFSDCIVSYCKLSPVKYYSEVINSVYGILKSYGSMLILSLARKKPFRAGVALGIATPFFDEGIYGPGFFKAYELESRVAQFPRIVIDDGVVNFLLNLKHRNPQLDNQLEMDLSWCEKLASECLEMIIRDVDGIFILDYLGNKFNEGISEDLGDEKLEEIFNKVRSFVDSEWKRFKDCQNNKLATRYFLLRSYVEDRLQRK